MTITKTQEAELAEIVKREGKSIDERLDDPDDPIHAQIVSEYRAMRRREAEETAN